MENKENIEEKINELYVDLENIERKIDKIINSICDNFLGKEIEHKSFKKGIVIGCKNAIIEIQFNEDVVKKFKIPDAFINKFLTTDKVHQEIMEQLKKLNEEKDQIDKEINIKKKILDEMISGKKIVSNNIICKEAKICIEKGNISVDDDIEFRTIRDVAELFNKHYEGYQRSWVKIDDDWQRIVGCFQMSSVSDRNIYRNILTDDENCFYYLINADTNAKKEEAVNGIINHEMVITYLFLKYPDTGYKFYGVFKKDIEAMKKSIEDKEYKVVYKKIDDELDLTQFFR
mgnify:CR=1 FL=1